MSEENKTEDEQSTNQSSQEEEIVEKEESTEDKLYKEKEEEKSDDKSEEEEEEGSGDKEEESEDSEEGKDKEEEEKKDGKEKDEKNPEKYDFKEPEKSVLSEEHLEGIASFAKEQGLSQEQAQAQVERENQLILDAQEKAKEQLDDLADNVWPEEVKKDKEIGGDNFNESVELSKRVFKRFGSEKLGEILNETGYGNHPELVRFAVKIGKAMSEDTLVHGKSSDSKEKPIEDVFYGE